jgi:hypothetical protein
VRSCAYISLSTNIRDKIRREEPNNKKQSNFKSEAISLKSEAFNYKQKIINQKPKGNDGR